MGSITRWEDYLVAQGVAQGAALSARRTLLRLLRTKFGELPTPAAMRIEQIEDVETLEALFERGLAAETLEQMRLDELPTGTPN